VGLRRAGIEGEGALGRAPRLREDLALAREPVVPEDAAGVGEAGVRGGELGVAGEGGLEGGDGLAQMAFLPLVPEVAALEVELIGLDVAGAPAPPRRPGL